jgi:hypothetical protein
VSRPRFGFLAGAVCVAITGGACADRTPQLDTSPPVPVVTDMVPTAVESQQLTVDLDETREVRSAVKQVGAQVLVSDARVWNLHHGQRLVGALQLATLKKRVDPREDADRRDIIGQILGGRARQIQVGGVPVWTIPDDGAHRSIYVWFGGHAFGVLQVKGDDINGGAIADELIHAIATQPAWQALPPQAYERKSDK